MVLQGWSLLVYTANFVPRYEEERHHLCIDRKMRLGVISAVLTKR